MAVQSNSVYLPLGSHSDWLTPLERQINSIRLESTMDGLESFIKTILFTEFGRKHAEGWMLLVAGVISFTGWMAAREMSGRVRRTKEEAQQNLSAENVMRASCHATDSGQITDATIRQEGTKYLLTLSVKNPTTEIYEKRQHFDSLEALAAFLEKSTVLRLGDFR